MTNWGEQFQRFYEKGDPQYDKDDDYLDLVMRNHIGSFLKSNPDLMYDHKFVAASLDWLPKTAGHTLFASYGRRLNTNSKFAEDAVLTNAYIIRDFDMSSAPHYSDICAHAISKSWRLFRLVEPTQCECILDLATYALQFAFETALRLHQKNCSNAYTIRFVTKNILPVTGEAGWSDEEQQIWRDKFNKIKFPS
tara:strand:+ start:15245 stop:15826 length:582 start_codon:yes stop_codon:yes gene_type:complete